MKNSLPKILKGLQYLKDAVSSNALSQDEVLEAVNLAQTSADFQDSLETLRPLNDWAKEQYAKILQGKMLCILHHCCYIETMAINNFALP